MVQVNTPYPATPMLTAFLRSRGVDAVQEDLSIRLALRLLSGNGLRGVAATLGRRFRPPAQAPESVHFFLAHEEAYRSTIDAVVAFLQGRDPALAYRIAGRQLLPEGPRFRQLAELAEAMAPLGRETEDPLGPEFGAQGVQDRAKYLASLYLDDLADVIRDGVDSRFAFARYAEKLAAGAARFDPIESALRGPPTLIDRMLDDLIHKTLQRHEPDLVAVTAPFPGNVYGAFRVAKGAKQWRRAVKTVVGGGYVSTELRELADSRVFRYFDYLVLDDGELPLLRLVEHIRGGAASRLVRTVRCLAGRVAPPGVARGLELRHDRRPAPVFDGLPLGDYLSLKETINPMHAMWSDGRWIKLPLAHGCYWRRCAFCDNALDYIRRYDPASPATVLRWMDRCAAETGQTGFHFVDEAAPPALLRRLSELLIAKRRPYTWWGNIRFERAFTPALARLMARAGCVGVAGALETASARTLALMDKGIALDTAARAADALADAGILVHAYLMYAFPTQTRQEAVDALEYVRQLFEAGAIHSAYWHRFALTAHSPIARHPERFGIRLAPCAPARFARNEIPYEDPVPVDWGAVGAGLRAAVYNYMLGIGLREDVRMRFGMPVKKPALRRDAVRTMLEKRAG